MERKVAHLQMIQRVTDRLSQNSFFVKGWSVVLVSSLFTLAASNLKLLFVYLAYFPALAFWILDGYFLWQERLFRALYDYVRNLDEDEVDFSMDTSIVKGETTTWAKAVFSKTLFVFHGAILAGITIVIIIALIALKGGK